MTRLIDISLPLQPDLPTWPGDPLLQRERFVRMEDGNLANVSQLACCVHIGTHVDAPYHFVADGNTVEHLALDTLVGEAVVAHLPDVESVTAADLERLALPSGVQRLLLRTHNSALWAAGMAPFREEYVALTEDAAQWVVDRGIRLIGVDYLSVQRYHDGPRTHQILLEAEVIILEGLNLGHVAPGAYELLCLPLKLVGSEGAPARAALRTYS
jgi:arylformamidase